MFCLQVQVLRHEGGRGSSEEPGDGGDGDDGQTVPEPDGDGDEPDGEDGQPLG